MASPGPTPPLVKGQLSEGPVSQSGKAMCLIKIHKNVASQAQELFHLSQSIRACVLPGKSGLYRKNFPNGFHMPAVTAQGLLRRPGRGQGASPPLPQHAHTQPQSSPSASCGCLDRRRHGKRSTVNSKDCFSQGKLLLEPALSQVSHRDPLRSLRP